VITDGAYRALREVADQVHQQLKLALVIAEGTGRRLSAPAAGYAARGRPVRAENNKKGYEQVLPC
jgi:hypothetical protein